MRMELFTAPAVLSAAVVLVIGLLAIAIRDESTKYLDMDGFKKLMIASVVALPAVFTGAYSLADLRPLAAPLAGGLIIVSFLKSDRVKTPKEYFEWVEATDGLSVLLLVSVGIAVGSLLGILGPLRPLTYFASFPSGGLLIVAALIVLAVLAEMTD